MALGDGLDIINFKDLYTAVARRVKGDIADAQTLARIKEAINTKYREVSNKKKWKWLREIRRSFTWPIKHTSGTISTTVGSRRVIGVGTGWSNRHRNWFLKPDGINTSYRVIAVVSSTVIALDSDYRDTAIVGGTYRMYPAEFPLWPNVADVDDIRIDGYRHEIRAVGPGEINKWRQRHGEREGVPRLYSIEGTAFFQGPVLGEFILGFDFLGQGFTRAISFYPNIPDKSYTVHLPYKLSIARLTEDTDQPLIPVEHRQILVFGVLADWYMQDRQDPTGSYYQNLFSQEIADMEAKYLDTDDKLQFLPMPMSRTPESYLRRHSSIYWETEG